MEGDSWPAGIVRVIRAAAARSAASRPRPGSPWIDSGVHSSRVDSCCCERRKPRASRKAARDSRWASQASQVLRRSGVCSRGLFQCSAQLAGPRQPRPEHWSLGEAASATGRVCQTSEIEERRTTTGEVVRRLTESYLRRTGPCLPVTAVRSNDFSRHERASPDRPDAPRPDLFVRPAVRR